MKNRRTALLLSQGTIPVYGLCGFIFAWWLCDTFRPGTTILLVTFLGSAALPMVCAEILKLQRSPRFSCKNPFQSSRVWTKFVGSCGILLFLIFIYWLFPEYRRENYDGIWPVLLVLASGWIVLSWPYIAFVDRYMDDPKDGLWCFGAWLLFRRNPDRQKILDSFLLGWAVKAFFLPFMLSGAVSNLPRLVENGVNLGDFGSFYTGTLILIYGLDITFGSIGYIFTLRILNAGIKSADSTAFGWIVTICCYVPFSTFIWSRYLHYKNGTSDWATWLGGEPLLLVAWGTTILLTMCIYVWATVAFGLRFSNLTNRCVIYWGPYQWCKHPAYLAKNIAWWLMAVPFVAHGNLADSMRGCVCLMITNLIYYARAKTEERHMSMDRRYRAYLRWISYNGLWAQCRNLLRCR
jgi:isoprenylcysteine carboxyl methyltransferase (ICMT) family protein YpbQ